MGWCRGHPESHPRTGYCQETQDDRRAMSAVEGRPRLTLAQASFSWTAVLLGSTCRANFRLLMVYSCPQYTRCGKERAKHCFIATDILTRSSSISPQGQGQEPPPSKHMRHPQGAWVKRPPRSLPTAASCRRYQRVIPLL